MVRVALHPRLTCRQKQSRPTPNGDTTPMPVIATVIRPLPDIRVSIIVRTMTRAAPTGASEPPEPSLHHAQRPSTGVLLFAWTGAALFLFALLYFLYSYMVRFSAPETHTTDPWSAASIDLLLFTVFALHHSVAARTSVKQRIQRVVPPILERAVYTWVASLLFLTVCASWRFVPGEVYHLTGLFAIAGYLVQSAGIIITIRSSARLDVLDLAGVRPVLHAKRGSAPVHVPLETRGLYGFVRHPLYFAWLLMVFGSPHMTMTRLVFAVVSSTYLAIAIPFEERSLIRIFGPDYRTYQRRVRWRLIPGVY